MSTIELTNTDVICLRTKQTRSHEGNLRYQAIVRESRAAYQRTNLRDEKSKIIRSIMQRVQENGGRFVKPEGQGWVEVDNATAYEKVSHALRSGKRALSKSLRKANKCTPATTPATPEQEQTAIPQVPLVPAVSEDMSVATTTAESILKSQAQIFEQLLMEQERMERMDQQQQQQMPEDHQVHVVEEVGSSSCVRVSLNSTTSCTAWECDNEEEAEDEIQEAVSLFHTVSTATNSDDCVLSQLFEVAGLGQLLE